MKISRWLTLAETSEGETLAWSSYTGALAKVDAEFLTVIDALREGRNIDADSHLVREMLRCGFIVGDDVDELAVYGELVRREKHRANSLKLVIAPTLDCNFSCPYCFETRRNVRMSRDIQEAITHYVRKKLEAGSVKAFSVVWYGGEPLIEPGIIAGLSESFTEICRDCGVRYTASIITNGYLADGDTAKLLKDCGVSFAQVTVDGSPEIHNSRRVLRASNAEGTYDRIIGGVNSLTASGIRVAVRMNIDRDNAGTVEDSIAELARVIRDKSRVSFSPGQVVNYEDENPACLTKKEYAAIIPECMRQCAKHNLPFSQKSSLPKIRASYCTAPQPCSFVIDPEGFVYKCWNDIGIQDYSIGDIYGLIDGGLCEEFSRSEWGRYNHMNYASCRDCGLLPVCAGGCPRGTVHFGRSPECEPCRYVIGELLAFQAKGGE